MKQEHLAEMKEVENHDQTIRIRLRKIISILMYLNRVPKIARSFFPPGIWEMDYDQTKPSVYITFDDGPHTVATPFVLEELKKFNAKGTFFCLGKNVETEPLLYNQILNEGHAVGNHTYDHPRLKDVSAEAYIQNVEKAKEWVNSNLFRPPYGRLSRKVGNKLIEQGFDIVYWSILSADFDTKLDPKDCLEKLIFDVKPGDIVVFHDSEKAFPRLEYVLPRFLNFVHKQGWTAEALAYKKNEE